MRCVQGGLCEPSAVVAMSYGMFLAADGANVQSKWLEVLANNLANVDTPGFKRELAVFQARPSAAHAKGDDVPGSRTINDLSGGVRFQRTLTDHSQGPFDHTGNATNLALAGDGFFQVERGGQTFLTRAGNFSFDKNGQLVTASGDFVLTSTSGRAAIDPSLGPGTIGDDGVIYQQEPGGARVPVSDVGVVRPGSLGDLVKQGDNLFRPLAEVTVVPQAERRIKPGFLERSTTRPTQEMMQLIEATRGLEANINMIRHHDQALGSLLNRALRTA